MCVCVYIYIYIHARNSCTGITSCPLLKRRLELPFFLVTIAYKNALLLAAVKMKMSGM